MKDEVLRDIMIYSPSKSAKAIWKCVSENDAAGLVGHYTKDLESPARAAPHNTPMLVAVMSKKWDIVRRFKCNGWHE
jgi:hypothetical protein